MLVRTVRSKSDGKLTQILLVITIQCIYMHSHQLCTYRLWFWTLLTWLLRDTLQVYWEESLTCFPVLQENEEQDSFYLLSVFGMPLQWEGPLGCTNAADSHVPIAVSTREQGNACLSSTTIILQHVYTMYNVIEATFGGNTNYNMQSA